MGRSQLARLKEVEKENQRLRRAVPDITLDKLSGPVAYANLFEAQLTGGDALAHFAEKYPDIVERVGKMV